MHILANIAIKKKNLKLKLGQLIEQNMRNVFLEKAYTKYGGESTCRPFSGLLYSSVCLHIQAEERQNILKMHLF